MEEEDYRRDSGNGWLMTAQGDGVEADDGRRRWSGGSFAANTVRANKTPFLESAFESPNAFLESAILG